MIEIEGNYYGRDSSRSSPAVVSLLGSGEVEVAVDGDVKVYRLADTRVSRRIGNVVRTLSFADGCLLESADNDAIDRYLGLMGKHQAARHVHRLERGWLWAGIAVLATVLASWAFIVFGLPVMATVVANSLPQEVDDQLGRDGLRLMDELVFEPSTIETDRQEELRDGFEQLAAFAEIDRNLQLEFRRGVEIGPNAFALPSGTIVMTDELVGLAENDDELAAVLAHEIGHVDGRHSLRLVLQDSIAAVIFAVVLGDITSISGLAGAIPVVLVQTRYSRSFETEADDYALDLMEEAGIARHHFSDILQRMQSDVGDSDFPDFLSSHPATAERVRRFEE